jgi:hypothetical protein
VSVEDQVRANERIPLLLQTPAAVRWISAEPLLGPVDLERIQVSPQSCGAGPARINAARLLDWVVVGGESGPHARPFDLQWALEIVRQCNAADTPVFVKQIGSAPQQTVRRQDDPLRILVRDRKGGDPAEWPLDLRVREYPQMNGRPWTPADVKALRALYPITPTKALAKRFRRRTIAVHAKAWNLGLRKTPAYLAAASVECGRRLAIAGAATRFPPGHVPWTKSTHFCAGGRSAETRFKPGNVSKRWDPEAYVIGALRINADGDLDIKVANGLRAWRSMVRFTWETERGPIPPGTAVRTINGDRHDTRIENLRLATKREVMLENTLHNYPKPLTRAIQLRGALTRKINGIERRRSAKHA